MAALLLASLPAFSQIIRVPPSVLSLKAQEWTLVWEDGFDGSAIDRSTWTFESGPTNDNIHYYTDRTENARIEDGVLKIIALKEAYQGFDYTSALIKTEQSLNWRYGRMEARIKLPGTRGFVPAFWMLPVDGSYGWWPYSGEIDIMEHPTNTESSIYGTVHTESYNLFSGSSPPQGGMVDINDAESEFHLYAVEWTEEQIDFYVNDQKYYTFFNDQGASDAWPFDQPFYIIVNLAVGGGWVGEPDQNTLFPAVMEVDYVRVYQHEKHAGILGADFLIYNSQGASYQLPSFEATEYQWKVPGGAQILSGQGSARIVVDWGLFGGKVEAGFTTDEGTFVTDYPVRISPNYLKNPGFERGVKYWKNRVGYPAEADFRLSSEALHGGDRSLFVKVKKPGTNAWDIQLSQGDLAVQGGTSYLVSFWARSVGMPENITAAIINPSNFALIAGKSVSLNETWTLVEFVFTPSSSDPLALNIDLGGHTGTYYFDDFILTTVALDELNRVENPDFFDGHDRWDLDVLSTAQASGSVENGVYGVSITDAGADTWDIHLQQSGLSIEKGMKYTLSFDARADAPRKISVLVGKDADPWTVYSGDNEISLTTNWENYSFSFTMNSLTDPLARLSFDIGGDPADVFFDHVLLQEVDPDPVPTSLQAGRCSECDLRIQPNPFNAQTRFNYVLLEPSVVTLKIFNQLGQEIESLVHEFQPVGEYELVWNATDHPAGTYIYHLQSGEENETGKLVILK